MLVEHFLATVFEQLQRLFALVHQIIDEDAKILDLVQHVHTVVVLYVNQLQMLIGVRKNVQNKRGRVLQVHLRMLAQFYHLVHQLPRLLDGLLVDDEPWWCDCVRDGTMHSAEETLRLHSFRTTDTARRHLYCLKHKAQHVK